MRLSLRVFAPGKGESHGVKQGAGSATARRTSTIPLQGDREPRPALSQMASKLPVPPQRIGHLEGSIDIPLWRFRVIRDGQRSTSHVAECSAKVLVVALQA